MPRPKKVVEEPTENVVEIVDNENDSLILKVMDRDTKKVIKIDWNKEKDWKTKYLHASGKEFN